MGIIDGLALYKAKHLSLKTLRRNIWLVIVFWSDHGDKKIWKKQKGHQDKKDAIFKILFSLHTFRNPWASHFLLMIVIPWSASGDLACDNFSLQKKNTSLILIDINRWSFEDGFISS